MKKIIIILALSLLSLGFYKQINTPIEQTCRGIEKSVIVFGTYDDILDYAHTFNLDISRIRKINATTYRLYYWITECFNV